MASHTYLLIPQSRKTLYLDGGRLLGAPTDWQILCTHYPFNFGSAAAVDRKLIVFRGRAERIQLRGLADGGGRRKRKTVEVTVAREERMGRGGAKSQLCGEAHRGGDVRARVAVREHTGVSA